MYGAACMYMALIIYITCLSTIYDIIKCLRESQILAARYKDNWYIHKLPKMRPINYPKWGPWRERHVTRDWPFLIARDTWYREVISRDCDCRIPRYTWFQYIISCDTWSDILSPNDSTGRVKKNVPSDKIWHYCTKSWDKWNPFSGYWSWCTCRFAVQK